MNNEDTDIDSIITIFNTAVNETASESLGKHRPDHGRNIIYVRQKERTEKEKTRT